MYILIDSLSEELSKSGYRVVGEKQGNVNRY